MPLSPRKANRSARLRVSATTAATPECRDAMVPGKVLASAANTRSRYQILYSTSPRHPVNHTVRQSPAISKTYPPNKCLITVRRQ